MSRFENFPTEIFTAVQIQLLHDDLMYYRNILLEI